ncbi:unnamed protein product [Microthlaspi erraticum]|uniref:Uncharacterized protein n=1 Tax=Microthlaspi erraticum TaxID=1685480 RepID=A0A6D2HPT2_9BRAS|nr:unnamed protein product [Microthlaspi erraticum]
MRMKHTLHTLTIFTKYGGTGRLVSSVKGSWKEQSGLALSGAFFVGWFGHSLINLYHRREYWYKVDRLWKETDTRTDEVDALDAQYRAAMNKKWSEKRKSTA